MRNTTPYARRWQTWNGFSPSGIVQLLVPELETVDLTPAESHLMTAPSILLIQVDPLAADQLRRPTSTSRKLGSAIHHITGRRPNYAGFVRHKGSLRYIRNARAADTIVKVRLSSVSPARFDV